MQKLPLTKLNLQKTPMENMLCEYNEQQGYMAHLTTSSPPSGVAFVGEMFSFRPMSMFVSSGVSV